MSSEAVLFRGWDQVRERLICLGPESVLRTIMSRAYHEARGPAGAFIGDGVHNYVNHHVLSRILIRLMLDSYRYRTKIWTPTTQERVLQDVMRQINYLIQERNERVCGSLPIKQRIAIRSWYAALELQCRQYPAMYEVARAWRMFRLHWRRPRPEILSKANGDDEFRHNELRQRVLRDPCGSSFNSMEMYLLLAVGVRDTNGWIGSAGEFFKDSAFASQADNFVAWYFPQADQAVGSWEDIENLDNIGFLNCFSTEPIIRLDETTLVAPDPDLMFGGLVSLIKRRLFDYFCNETSDLSPEHAHREKRAWMGAETLIGYVFEDYACELIQLAGRYSSRDRCEKGQFKLEDGSEAPEAFLLGDGAVIFEIKAAFHPPPTVDVATLGGLLTWMRKASGERLNVDGSVKRPALRQATSFIDKWRRGDPETLKRLGPLPSALTYVIVTPEPGPYVIQAPDFRLSLWQPTLEHEDRQTDELTAFISIQDLELLVSVLMYSRKQGKPTSAIGLLRGWMRERLSGNYPPQAVQSPVLDLKASFREYLAKAYPKARKVVVKPLAESYDEYFKAASEAGFG